SARLRRDDHSSSLAIAGEIKQPTRELRMGHPFHAGACAPDVALLFGLAPCGVLPATRVTTSAVRSYRTFSPLPHPERPAKAGRDECGGIFSVPLSFGLPRPGVTQRTALRSSDFPPSTFAPCGAPVDDGRLARCDRPNCRLSVRFLRDLVLFQLLVQVAAGRVDDFGGLRDVPAALAQLGDEERALGVVLELAQ